jgi:hypothetical protein
MIDPDEIKDRDDLSRKIGEVSKERRGKYAEEAAQVYLDRIKELGGFGSSEDPEPEIYGFIDCMDVAIHTAKKEYMESKNIRGLEKLGLFCIEALTRKNAVECLRTVSEDVVVLNPKTKEKLEWLENENNKQEHIELGLCDEFDTDYRKKK